MPSALLIDEITPDFRLREEWLICDAINNFGEGDHPIADPDTLKFFTVPYVLSCLTKLARHHGHESDEYATALQAMDEINNSVQQYRKESNDA